MLSGQISTSSINQVLQDLLQDSDVMLMAIMKINLRRIEFDEMYSSEERELARALVERPIDFLASIQLPSVGTIYPSIVEKYIEKAELEWRK